MVASYAVGPMLIYLLTLGGWGLPLGIPPGPEDPVLANVAPENCLAYLSWAGTARPDPKSANQTEQLLAEPEVQAAIAELRRMLRRGANQMAGRDEPETAQLGEKMLSAAETILRSPGAVFLAAVRPEGGSPDVRGGIVLNLGDEVKRVHGTVEEIQQRAWKDRVRTAQIGGRGWHQISLGEGLPAIFWGSHKGYLIAAIGEDELQSLLGRMDKRPPAWLASVRQQCAVPRPANVFYVNVKAGLDLAWPLIPDPQMKTTLEALGVRSVTHLAAVTGLDEAGVVTRTVLGLEGRDLGLFGLADVTPLSVNDLSAIPRDATVAAAFRLEPERTWETFVGLLERIDPQAKEEFARGVSGLDAEVGFSLRDDVIKSLGSAWSLYASPSEGSSIPWGLTAVVRLKDPARFAKANDKLAARLRAEFPGEEQPHNEGPQFRQFRFAGREVCCLTVGRFGPPFGIPVSPSWCVTQNELILALSPQGVKAALTRPAGRPSLATARDVTTLFVQGKAPVKLLYVDAADIFRGLYSWAQTMIQVSRMQGGGPLPPFDPAALPSAGSIGRHLRPTVAAVWRTRSGIEMIHRQTLPAPAGMALPAAGAVLIARVASSPQFNPQTQSINNLKQIGLALHNYVSVHRIFPPAYSVDKEGKPLLSWRVHILPYVDQAQLYQQFRLDEPWDSEHNKKLLQQTPPVYRTPRSKAEPEKATYLAVRGAQTIFPGKDPIGFAQITDGTSSTVMVVEVPDALAVAWTKPDDFMPDPKDPAKKLFDSRKSVLSLFADGSVRVLGGGVNAQTWAALFSRNGGEVISPNELEGRSPDGPRPPVRKRLAPVKPVPPPAAEPMPKSAAPAGPFSRARDTARRSQSINNLKQIALALHNYHDVYKTFPAASHPDKQGKPRLSWRVAILPFVEQASLYQEFRFGETWDSEHNKKLIARMPDVYRSPNSRAPEGKTNYLSVRGPRTVFPGPGKQAGIRDILDGTSNTIAVVEASDQRAVIWTKPDDFEPDADNPIQGLVGLQGEGFLAAFADGSVQYLSAKIDPDTLRALFDRADGQAVDVGRWRVPGR